MKTAVIYVQVPKWIDDLLKQEAIRRMATKSLIVREVLADYARSKQAEQAPESTAKAA